MEVKEVGESVGCYLPGRPSVFIWPMVEYFYVPSSVLSTMYTEAVGQGRSQLPWSAHSPEASRETGIENRQVQKIIQKF